MTENNKEQFVQPSTKTRPPEDLEKKREMLNDPNKKRAFITVQNRGKTKKEDYYVDFNTLTIHHKNFVERDKILVDNKFSKLAKDLNHSLTEDYWLSIRQVLQYFGTEIMRYYFGDKL